MHELSIAHDLVAFLEKLRRSEDAERILTVRLRINPYSCLDDENLNFVFSALTREKPALNPARIVITRSETPGIREVTVENVEIEVNNDDKDD